VTTIEIHSRKHDIDVLKRIIPHCREAVPKFYDLATRFSSAGWRDLFFRFWEEHARCLMELETKVRECGGRLDSDIAADIPTPLDPDDEPVDPLSLDKALLLRCVNQQSHLTHLYTEARKNTLPFDMRMLLQRHHLQARETLTQLSNVYLNYPSSTIVLTHGEHLTMKVSLLSSHNAKEPVSGF